MPYLKFQENKSQSADWNGDEVRYKFTDRQTERHADIPGKVIKDPKYQFLHDHLLEIKAH